MFISSSPQLYEETGLGGARLLVGHSRLWATQPQAVSSVGHLALPPNPLHHPDPQCLAPCMTYLFPPPVSPELLHSPFPPFSPPATSATPGGSRDNPTRLKSLLSWRGPWQPSSALEPGPGRRAASTGERARNLGRVLVLLLRCQVLSPNLTEMPMNSPWTGVIPSGVHGTSSRNSLKARIDFLLCLLPIPSSGP